MFRSLNVRSDKYGLGFSFEFKTDFSTEFTFTRVSFRSIFVVLDGIFPVHLFKVHDAYFATTELLLLRQHFKRFKHECSKFSSSIDPNFITNLMASHLTAESGPFCKIGITCLTQKASISILCTNGTRKSAIQRYNTRM